MLLPEVLRTLAETGVDDVVVVEGAHPLQALGSRAARLVPCADWERGPGASLRCGLAALPAGTEAAVVVLADGPNLDPEAVDRLVDAWRSGAGSLLAASYDGTRSHPLLVARALWDDVPDDGLRARDPVLVACEGLRPPGDVDRPGDLPERLR